ncbi:MAG: Gfo/Idh/MocA family oxidoreductase, partial [Acidimicrobiales bacterium]
MDVKIGVIASPDATHARFTTAAIGLGKATMCEKPLAPTLAECRPVLSAEEEAVGDDRPRLVSVGFMRRFDPGYVQVKAYVEAAEHGVPLLFMLLRTAGGALATVETFLNAGYGYDIGCEVVSEVADYGLAHG